MIDRPVPDTVIAKIYRYLKTRSNDAPRTEGEQYIRFIGKIYQILCWRDNLFLLEIIYTFYNVCIVRDFLWLPPIRWLFLFLLQ